MVFRGPQMVGVCTALATGLPRGHGQRPLARHSRDRFKTRAPQRNQGRGGTKPLNFHAGKITMTTSWRRQSLSCSQQDYSPNLSVHPNQPFQLGLLRNLLQLMQDRDIGLIDSCRVRIPHGCVRTNTVLVFGAANRPKHEKTCFNNLRHELEVS